MEASETQKTFQELKEGVCIKNFGSIRGSKITMTIHKKGYKFVDRGKWINIVDIDNNIIATFFKNGLWKKNDFHLEV